MLHSYFKTAFRSLGRYPLHTALNVLGLSIGIASCILAMMYIRREYAVDDFHEGGDRIYRVVRETRNASSEHVFQPGATGALAPVLEAECPEIERVMARVGASRARRVRSATDSSRLRYSRQRLLRILLNPFSSRERVGGAGATKLHCDRAAEGEAALTALFDLGLKAGRGREVLALYAFV